MGFCVDQLARIAPLWDRMLAHRFLVETRDGTIADETFARWMRQDYLFVEAAIPFLGALIAKSPGEHQKPLADSLVALHAELELFRDRARAVGVDLAAAEPAFICHAYIQFLFATAHRGSYAEGFTVLTVAEKAYHDSWKIVRAGIDPLSPWMPFVDKWAGDAFAGYVAYLEGELDRLAKAASPDEREAMARVFELAVRYEIAFWELAVSGEIWPGLEPGEDR